jgi:hypothetical protein
MDKTSSYIEFTDQMSKLLANLQKERELSLSYINSYAQTKKDDLENQIKLSRLSHEKLDIFINSFYLIKKDHKLFDKYEIFKTNISLLLTFSKKSKNQILHSTNPFIKGF